VWDGPRRICVQNKLTQSTPVRRGFKTGQARGGAERCTSSEKTITKKKRSEEMNTGGPAPRIDCHEGGKRDKKREMEKAASLKGVKEKTSGLLPVADHSNLKASIWPEKDRKKGTKGGLCHGKRGMWEPSDGGGGKKKTGG